MGDFKSDWAVEPARGEHADRPMLRQDELGAQMPADEAGDDADMIGAMPSRAASLCRAAPR